MRILIAHNRYQQRGGEDTVVDTETAMLREAGHSVSSFFISNDDISGVAAKVSTALNSANNSTAVAQFVQAVEREKPEIVHFHNLFPRLSPGAVAASLARGIPTVQTLHNFRMMCAGAMLMRDGKICESCVGRSHWPGVRHRCYRGSALGSWSVNRAGQRFRKLCRQYPQLRLIVLTEFAKSRFVADGYAPDQICVKPNTVADCGIGSARRERRIVFVGRCSYEKGADFLMRVARQVDAQFEIIGDGPDLAALKQNAPGNVTFSGHLPRVQVLERIKTAAAVAMPSRWYEGFPMVLLETFSTATPVIASRIGSLAELVQDGQTGLLAGVDDEAGWTDAARQILDDAPMARWMGSAARAVYEMRYGEAENGRQLGAIYQGAIMASKRKGKQP